MKYRGARAVLAKSMGKLIISIKAKNSICPGRINANDKLIMEVIVVIKRLIVKIMYNLQVYSMCVKDLKL